MARLAFALALALWCMPAAAFAVPVEHVNGADANAGTAKLFSSDPAGAIQRARESVAAGDLAGAVKNLEIYVASHPNEVAPKRFLGDLYFRQGRLSDAERVYVALIQANANDKETHNRLGTVYALESKVDDAISQFNASLPGTDSVPDLVALHERKGDLPSYRSQMELLAVRNPESADLQSELGQVYEVLHQPGSAVLEYQKALRIDSTSLSALNGLGLAYLDLHDYRSAANQFQLCLSIDPFNYSCTDNLGATDLESGRLTEAEATLNSARRLAPERPEALVNFGYLADARGEWRKAVGYYVNALAVWPYSREAYVDLGLAYEQHSLYPLAQEALLKGLSAVPDDGRIRYLLGRAYEAQGKRDLAIAQYRAAANSIDPDVARIAQAHASELVAKPQ